VLGSSRDVHFPCAEFVGAVFVRALRVNYRIPGAGKWAFTVSRMVLSQPDPAPPTCEKARDANVRSNTDPCCPARPAISYLVSQGRLLADHAKGIKPVNSIIYIVGLVVVVLIILGFFGLR